MSMVLCDLCLAWVRLHQDRCPQCWNEIDLLQPEPTLHQIRQRTGTWLYDLGAVDLLRKPSSLRLSLHAATGGLLLTPAAPSECTGADCTGVIHAGTGARRKQTLLTMLQPLGSVLQPLLSLLSALPGRRASSAVSRVAPLACPGAGGAVVAPHLPHADGPVAEGVLPAPASPDSTPEPPSTGMLSQAAGTPDPAALLMQDPRCLFLERHRIVRLTLSRRKCLLRLRSAPPVRLTVTTDSAAFRAACDRLSREPGWQAVFHG